MIGIQLLEEFTKARDAFEKNVESKEVEFQFRIRARLFNGKRVSIWITRLEEEVLYGRFMLDNASTMAYDHVEEIINPNAFMSFSIVRDAESPRT